MVLQGNLCCFRKLGHRATGSTNLTTQNHFLALGQILQMFLVCLDIVSAKKFNEGIVSSCPILMCSPSKRRAMLITGTVVFHVECLRGNNPKQNSWGKMHFVYILTSWIYVNGQHLSCFCGDFNAGTFSTAILCYWSPVQHLRHTCGLGSVSPRGRSHYFREHGQLCASAIAYDGKWNSQNWAFHIIKQ